MENSYIYNDIITQSPVDDLISEYSEMNNLIKQNLENHTMPYNFENPFPMNINIVNGNNLDSDINIDKVELKARSIGAKSTMFIYGADAGFLGLELKSYNKNEYDEAKTNNSNFNCEPLNIRISLADTDTIYCQKAYLLDQFTNESVSRLYDVEALKSYLNYSPKYQELVENIANQIISNTYRYNENLERKYMGIDENGRLKYKIETPEERDARYHNTKKNIFLNMNKDMNTTGYKSFTNHLSNLTNRYFPQQKQLFDVMMKYHINQKCPGYVSFTQQQKDNYDKATASLLLMAESNPTLSGIITRTMFDGFATSERLSHLNFSIEPVYTQEENKFRTKQKAKAMQPEEPEHSVLENRTKQPQRSFNMHVGQDIGM